MAEAAKTAERFGLNTDEKYLSWKKDTEGALTNFRIVFVYGLFFEAVRTYYDVKDKVVPK